jgi:hypothetical protein
LYTIGIGGRNMGLVPWLVERQRSLREGDRPFAKRLGVSNTFWWYVRTGKRGLSLRIVVGACKSWPEERATITSLAIDQNGCNRERVA